MRALWKHIVHLFVKAVELHHSIDVAILLILKLFYVSLNSVVTGVRHRV